MHRLQRVGIGIGAPFDVIGVEVTPPMEVVIDAQKLRGEEHDLRVHLPRKWHTRELLGCLCRSDRAQDVIPLPKVHQKGRELGD